MAYAVRADVHAKWPLASPVAEARADAVLAEAEAVLDRLLPDLAANVAALAVDPVLARMVVTNAVIRVLANPGGASMQTIGPESVQFTGVRTLGAVAFTDAELALLAPATPGAVPAVAGSAVGSASIGFPWLPIGPAQ